jgi:hypothetical protein
LKFLLVQALGQPLLLRLIQLIIFLLVAVQAGAVLYMVQAGAVEVVTH